ncbi:tryptophan synthase subunit alpha [Candidatus Pantoea edessiphila]|uniref:Tryptophan synthase alpha chain n=1 Tax=Candidatus Pantoea edessiphila TaxID=2044610 RepID=A0A2P5SYS8_9GAMM|nr:tryptophan synthase subunit alpha [Candidatus Pantoea edessiphila]MBK4775418.1 tryptophan synthase subunit alpha [Pantoea sp. Edef]PPI87452.1 tryptophan synthase subunit alpha [Candidatus Pantoea edessiphila]
MKRYKQLFNKLKNNKQGAFLPFIVLGDPTPEISLKIIDTLILAGADALELGIPFSDPLADGPIIQNSNFRALNAGNTVIQCFEMISKIRHKYFQLPIGLLIYANLVFSRGIENFYINCSKLGVDSILIADLPIEESKPFRETALYHGIDQIFICPPNPSDDLLYKIATQSYGYIYLLSRTGVTGIEKPANLTPKIVIDKLHSYKSSPLIQGFGIYDDNQVKQIIASGIDGIIVGSALIKIIEDYFNTIDIMLREIKIMATKFKSASIKFC